ncbi:hypothetical protein EDC45_1770 [Mesocricetibacter intestinalis]|uniref:Uncharacterized protein n=1 Tax=Mesocricetibacter intestinalis TaxID=1521930 RepID=A0A4R6VAH7_9PAST|nr:hypothetical protein EDC45_1770 [Mesocricetibacter intestinalis]
MLFLYCDEIPWVIVPKKTAESKGRAIIGLIGIINLSLFSRHTKSNPTYKLYVGEGGTKYDMDHVFLGGKCL